MSVLTAGSLLAKAAGPVAGALVRRARPCRTARDWSIVRSGWTPASRSGSANGPSTRTTCRSWRRRWTRGWTGSSPRSSATCRTTSARRSSARSRRRSALSHRSTRPALRDRLRSAALGGAVARAAPRCDAARPGRPGAALHDRIARPVLRTMCWSSPPAAPKFERRALVELVRRSESWAAPVTRGHAASARRRERDAHADFERRTPRRVPAAGSLAPVRGHTHRGETQLSAEHRLPEPVGGRRRTTGSLRCRPGHRTV